MTLTRFSRQRRRSGSWWGAFTGLTLVVALWWGWLMLARVDFLYPLWYDMLHIDQTIATYGPRNRQRPNFQQTPRAERERLFAAMVTAIHRQGAGLEQLVYHDAAGRPLGQLLTASEVVHLQDVARLVDGLARVGWTATVAWVGWLVVLRHRRLPPPSLPRLLFATTSVLLGAGLAILLLGPVRVFYKLHTWIFPPGHPWFFYYEDSLMTMLMQAPNLFGGIALTLVGLNLVLFPGLLAVGRWLTSDSSPIGMPPPVEKSVD